MAARPPGPPRSSATPPPARDLRRPDAPKSTSNALAVLRCFDGAHPELSAADLARRLGLRSSTLYRYLALLEDQGFVTRVGGTSRYALGLTVIELGGVALGRLEVRRHGQEVLESLADATNANANLAVLDSGDTVHIAYAVRSDVDRLYAIIGRRTPAHCTALGKALLAFQPWDKVAATVNHFGWRPLTDRSIRTFEALQEELAATRDRGYAVELGENHPTSGCVAAPVRERGGEVIAAVSVTTQLGRVQAPAGDQIAAAVTAHAEHLSAKLGFLHPVVRPWRPS